jgi:hypothetical protein
MAASSGFRGSHEHVALGNAVCIAPMRSHGHQKWAAMEVHLIVINNFAIKLTIDNKHSNT